MPLFISHTRGHTQPSTQQDTSVLICGYIYFIKTSYINCRCTNTQFNKILYVICKLELYKCEFLPILTGKNCAENVFKKGKTKEKKENILEFNYLKIPHALSCSRGSRRITPKEVGVTLCLALPRLLLAV